MRRHECTANYYLGHDESVKGRKRWVVCGPDGLECEPTTEAAAQKLVDKLNQKNPPECDFCSGEGCSRCDRR